MGIEKRFGIHLARDRGGHPYAILAEFASGHMIRLTLLDLIGIMERMDAGRVGWVPMLPAWVVSKDKVVIREGWLPWNSGKVALSRAEAEELATRFTVRGFGA